MMNDDHLCISRCRLIELNTLNSSPTPVLQDTDMPTVQHQWFHAFGISFQMEQRSTRTRRTKLLSLIRVLMAQATTNRINNHAGCEPLVQALDKDKHKAIDRLH